MRYMPDHDRHYPIPDVPELLVDGDLTLRLFGVRPARPHERWAAECVFTMLETGCDRAAGEIRLRLADTEELLFYGGHVGYGVEEPYRGRRYAARAVRLILPIAWAAGMEELWITCYPSNVASRRSIEIAGGEFAEIVPIPEYSPMFARGFRESCRYRFTPE